MVRFLLKVTNSIHRPARRSVELRIVLYQDSS